jgi:hypothetical protein
MTEEEKRMNANAYKEASHSQKSGYLNIENLEKYAREKRALRGL